jgi:hypothetical protein
LCASLTSPATSLRSVASRAAITDEGIAFP